MTTERDAKHAALEQLRSTSPEEIWLEDLENLEDALDDFENALTAEGGAVRKRAAGGKKANKHTYDEDSDEDFAMDDDSDDDDFGAKKKKKKKVGTHPISDPQLKP